MQRDDSRPSRPNSAAIIAIGSEMLGPTRVDTNSLKVTSVLETFAVSLARKSVIGDDRSDLVAELRYALDRCDILITSGGLGPTEDDLTREALAEAFGLEMQMDQSLVERLEARFALRGTRMPEPNRRQANVFVGQTTLINERGTAPGFHIQTRGKDIWVFPGVPHELEWMVSTYFKPWLEEVCGSRARHRRVLKIAGMAESAVDEKLRPYYDAHPGELVTILASGGQIEIHLNADGTEDEARPVLDAKEKELRAIFGDRIFGYEDDSLESVIGAILTSRGETLATAESCTGGLLGSRITDISGSSKYYLGGGVCYTAEAKTRIAAVDPDLIRANGEVSEEVARALARGIRERFGSTWGVGVTGIAGPTGGTPEKPVGTVHIAVAGPDGESHRRFFWQGSRTVIKWFATQNALDLLRNSLIAKE